MHRGAGAPTVRLRWMYTDQPFLPLGTHCVLINRIWDEDQSSDLEVGQLPPDEADYVQDNRWVLPAFALGGHICHPEWLQVGEPWPTSLPDTVYQDSVPVCCCVLSYDVHALQETARITSPSLASLCKAWIGLGPVTGKAWTLLAPQVGLPQWVLRRRRNGLPTFITYLLDAALWNGHGTSPPFAMVLPDDPTIAGDPIYVTEVT